MKITGYTIISLGYPMAVANEVTRALAQGWELHGDLQVTLRDPNSAVSDNIRYTQVMVKRDRTATDVAVDKYKQGQDGRAEKARRDFAIDEMCAKLAALSKEERQALLTDLTTPSGQ